MVLLQSSNFRSSVQTATVPTYNRLTSSEAEAAHEAEAAQAAEAEGLRVRTELMLSLQRYIDRQQWGAAEAAHAFRLSSPRMQNLLSGEISRFSIEDLIQMLARVGLTVEVAVHALPATALVTPWR
ncbi:MAG: XRE family transcriptional regulator [Cyanobacteria bacterium J06648_16]